MNSKIQNATRALQKNILAAQNDPYRPQYHFTPPANWMNDPNGTIYHDGEYHLFYQHNPYKPKWGRLHWGHAKSVDLVHWEHLPIALAPDGFPGELHCWSGCCVIADDGTPTIFYTSMNARALLFRATRHSQQWMATSNSGMLAWEKYPQNPVLSEDQQHPGSKPIHWRDPYVWKDGDAWYMVLGGRQPGDPYGSVFLYESRNLFDWKYVGILAQGKEVRCKAWECSNYFKLGDEYVLIVSPYRQVMYSIGRFQDFKHTGKDWHIFDHGGDFYATNTYVDDGGRTVVVGWIKARGKSGWAGCLSLPREVKLSAGRRLRISPVPELEALRQRHQRFERKLEQKVEVAGTAPFFGDCVEIKASFDLKEAEAAGFTLTDDKKEEQIGFDFETQTLKVIHDRARLQFERDSGRIDFHIFIDKSVIEVFINGREAFTTTFHPRLHEHNALKIAPFVKGGVGSFRVDFWTLAGIW